MACTRTRKCHVCSSEHEVVKGKKETLRKKRWEWWTCSRHVTYTFPRCIWHGSCLLVDRPPLSALQSRLCSESTWKTSWSLVNLRDYIQCRFGLRQNERRSTRFLFTKALPKYLFLLHSPLATSFSRISPQAMSINFFCTPSSWLPPFFPPAGVSFSLSLRQVHPSSPPISWCENSNGSKINELLSKLSKGNRKFPLELWGRLATRNETSSPTVFN